MVGITYSKYAPVFLCDIYLSEVKSYIIEVNPSAIQLFHRVPSFSDSSDISRGIYPRVVFMAVLAVHPEAIIQGSYYKDCGY